MVCKGSGMVFKGSGAFWSLPKPNWPAAEGSEGTTEEPKTSQRPGAGASGMQ